MADKPYELNFSENNEVDIKFGKFLTHFYSLKYTEEEHKNWYAGITGQADKDGDGKSDRYLAHKAYFKDMDHDTWMELSVTNDEVAKAIETKLLGSKFDTGDKIQGDDNVDKVYVFRKVIWLNAIKPNSEND